MIIVIATISIFLIAAAVWVSRRILPFRICPICAGVSGTWLWIVAGMYFGWLETEGWQLIAAIAMGGSVVGIAYQMEKYLSEWCSPVLWKMLFIPTGFVLAYSILLWWWAGAVVSASLCVVWLLSCWKKLHRITAQSEDVKVKELENKMKNNCC